MNVLNNILKFLENPYFQISVIVILVIVIIWLISEKFRDGFENDLSNFYDFERVPPHIEQLEHGQMVRNDSDGRNDSDYRVDSQEPSNSNKDGLSKNPPNYHLHNQLNTSENTQMGPGRIYRMNTGRDAYQQEQFVSIYDANFGGLLGTSMGL